MDEQHTPTAGTPIYQESQDRNAKWLWLLIVLIIVGALVFAFVRGIGPFAKISPFSKEEESSPIPESSPFSFASPTPEASAGAAEVDKGEPAIRILNGSGVAGVASAVKDLLEGKGYRVEAVGNADEFGYEQTVLRFKKGFEKFEKILTGDLSDDYSVTTGESELEATDSADIEVIVGAK